MAHTSGSLFGTNDCVRVDSEPVAAHQQCVDSPQLPSGWQQPALRTADGQQLPVPVRAPHGEPPRCVVFGELEPLQSRSPIVQRLTQVVCQLVSVVSPVSTELPQAKITTKLGKTSMMGACLLNQVILPWELMTGLVSLEVPMTHRLQLL